MESRIKGRVLSIIVAVAMIASTSTALAATSKPTPKPTPKATAKSTKKAVAKKPAVKTTTKSTKKAVAKKSTVKKTTTKKRTVIKRPSVKKTTTKKRTVYKRQVVKVSPSPSPTWPPSGFSHPSGEIYYKIPTSKELASLASADALLTSQLQNCLPNKFACGVVRLASVTGCTWWEIDSIIYGPLSATDSSIVPYGTLRTTAKGTNAKQIVTVLLISTEPLKPKVTVSGLNISCYHSPVTEKIPTNVYTINTPSPSATPTTNTN